MLCLHFKFPKFSIYGSFFKEIISYKIKIEKIIKNIKN